MQRVRAVISKSLQCYWQMNSSEALSKPTIKHVTFILNCVHISNVLPITWASRFVVRVLDETVLLLLSLNTKPHIILINLITRS